VLSYCHSSRASSSPCRQALPGKGFDCTDSAANDHRARREQGGRRADGECLILDELVDIPVEVRSPWLD
jgi:hypothetical protein